MTVTVSGTVFNGVRWAAESGDDPLGVSADNMVLTERNLRVRRVTEEALDGVDEDLAHRVSESLARRLSGTKTIGNPQGLMPIDPLFAQLVAHVGVDPLVATWLAIKSGIVDLDDEDTGYLLGRVDGTCHGGDHTTRGSIALKRDGRTFWHQQGHLVLPGRHPDSVSDALVGGPLTRLLSHPVLDSWNLTIVSVDTDDGGVTTVTTDHRARSATMAELLAAAPDGCR